MSRYRWENGQRIPKNAAEEASTHRVILELDVELYDELERYCTDRGESIEECIVNWIEAGLPDDQDASKDDADRKKEQKKQADDGRDSGRLSEHDEDNQRVRPVVQAPVKDTATQAHERFLEVQGRINACLARGDFAGAKLIEQNEIGYHKVEAKLFPESKETARQQLTAAIIKAGNSLVRP